MVRGSELRLGMLVSYPAEQSGQPRYGVVLSVGSVIPGLANGVWAIWKSNIADAIVEHETFSPAMQTYSWAPLNAEFTVINPLVSATDRIRSDYVTTRSITLPEMRPGYVIRRDTESDAVFPRFAVVVRVSRTPAVWGIWRDSVESAIYAYQTYPGDSRAFHSVDDGGEMTTACIGPFVLVSTITPRTDIPAPSARPAQNRFIRAADVLNSGDVLRYEDRGPDGTRIRFGIVLRKGAFQIEGRTHGTDETIWVVHGDNYAEALDQFRTANLNPQTAAEYLQGPIVGWSTGHSYALYCVGNVATYAPSNNDDAPVRPPENAVTVAPDGTMRSARSAPEHQPESVDQAIDRIGAAHDAADRREFVNRFFYTFRAALTNDARPVRDFVRHLLDGCATDMLFAECVENTDGDTDGATAKLPSEVPIDELMRNMNTDEKAALRALAMLFYLEHNGWNKENIAYFVSLCKKAPEKIPEKLVVAEAPTRTLRFAPEEK